jgi:uncharacterized membrane protein
MLAVAIAGILFVLAQVGLQGVTSQANLNKNSTSPLVYLGNLLSGSFYCVTALAAVVYYRRRVMSNWWDILTIGILPIAAVIFLAYITVKSILSAPAAQNYSLLGFVVVRLILIFVARFGWRSEFFKIRRES